jgi:mannose-6-phosphate isomerase-like protein (cupin superfamily)
LEGLLRRINLGLSHIRRRKLVSTDALRGKQLTSDALRRLLYFGDDKAFASKSMKPIQGYHLIKPEDLFWRPSNLMRIPNADYLERTGSENMGARLWRPPPKSANTLHKHIRQEEFYFVLEGTAACA